MDFTEASWADSRMDFRRRKLYLTLGITGIGMLIAVIWHGWQGWGLGRSYPYNTFLFVPKLQFGDFTDSFEESGLPSPYDDRRSTYFPFAYDMLRCFTLLSPLRAASLFLSLISLGFVAALLVALRPMISSVKELLLCAGGLLAFSYPFLVSLDRANLELMMALPVSIALLCFRNRRWTPGLGCLFSAICMKLYPILLLALLLRPKHGVKIVIVAVAFLIVTFCSLTSFAHSIETNWRHWHDNLQSYADSYIIHNWGFAGSASAWNMVKALMISSYYLVDPAYDPKYVFPYMALLNFVYRLYVILAVGLALTVISYIILIEREFFRRVILLLLLVTMAIPSGPDYKLLYANIALVVFILLPKQRPHDLLVTGLLAFVMVPKKEIFLPFLGTTDAGFHDISIAILLNPPCMLAAIVLMIRDGFRTEINPHMRQRFFGIINPIWRMAFCGRSLF